MNRQNYGCIPTNASKDKCLADEALAQAAFRSVRASYRGSVDSHFWPRLISGSLGTQTFIEEVSPVMPWTLFLGAGFAVDTQERPVKEVVRTVEKVSQVKAKGRINGFIHETAEHDSRTKCHGGVGESHQWTSLAAGTDGKFTSFRT